MTKKKFIRFIQASLFGATIALAVPACTDDHFDVADSGSEGSNATKTLWEQIEARPELNHFAEIVRKTPYFKDEAHPSKEYTYKDVLNGTQVFTVFAPTNEALEENNKYQEMLSLLETSPYDVYLQLVGNQIALHNYVATGTGSETLVTINSKRATFDRENGGHFQNLDLKEANIGATNGTLHTMDVLAPFHYNIYEYIKANGSTYSELKTWITEHDTIYFSADNSIEGGSDRDGNPIYVDSVYFRTNTLFNNIFSRDYDSDYEAANEEWLIKHKVFGANLEAEDSVWAMALPTDVAWQAAKAAIEPYYTYSAAYKDKSLEDTGTTGPDFVGEKANDDSLKTLSIRMDLASCLVFNARLQPRYGEDRKFWTAETFQQTEMPKMFNTRIDTFTVEEKPVSDVKSLLLGTTPIVVSNGLVYPVNEWKFFQPYGAMDLDIEVTDHSIFQYNNLGTTTVEYVPFNNSTSALVTDSLLGRVYKDRFYYISNGTSAPTINIKLIDTEHKHQVMSNLEYEIGFVMVPDFYRFNSDSIISQNPERLAAQKNKLRAQITYNNGVTSRGAVDEKKSSNFDFEYRGEKVDTIWTDENGKPMTFTFPLSYKNITKSYPTISITSRSRSSDIRDNYQHPFSIDRIILRAKR